MAEPANVRDALRYSRHADPLSRGGEREVQLRLLQQGAVTAEVRGLQRALLREQEDELRIRGRKLQMRVEQEEALA